MGSGPGRHLTRRIFRIPAPAFLRSEPVTFKRLAGYEISLKIWGKTTPRITVAIHHDGVIFSNAGEA